MKKGILITAIFLLAIATFSFAQHGHMGDMRQPAMKMTSIEVFADGVQASFMVMKNENHKVMLKNMNMQEEIPADMTHNLMVTVRDENTGKELSNRSVTITVIDPNDNEQTKPASFKEMMRSYDAYFKMPGKGKYQIRLGFEVGGQKRSIGIAYDMT